MIGYELKLTDHPFLTLEILAETGIAMGKSSARPYRIPMWTEAFLPAESSCCLIFSQLVGKLNWSLSLLKEIT